MSKKGMSLIEVLITSVIIVIIVVSMVDLLSSMVIAQSNLNNDIQAKQTNLNIEERIATALKEGVYTYANGTLITIPTSNSYTTVTNGSNAIAVLIPAFASDGSLINPSTNVTSFVGEAFSIIPENTWDGVNSGKYVIIETSYSDNTLNISTDPNDSLLINASPPRNWKNGTSFILGKNLIPASFTNMGTTAFSINSTASGINYAFVPNAAYTYFPSSSGSKIIDDTSYLSSVTFKNWRNTNF